MDHHKTDTFNSIYHALVKNGQLASEYLDGSFCFCMWFIIAFCSALVIQFAKHLKRIHDVMLRSGIPLEYRFSETFIYFH